MMLRVNRPTRSITRRATSHVACWPTLYASRMYDWFQELREVGFVVIPGPVAPDRVAWLAAAYDSAVASASPEDVGIGRTTDRVHDFVNRGAEFDDLYIYQPVLEACCRIIEQPFRLSLMLARTVRLGSPAQPLHVDFEISPLARYLLAV